MLMDMELEKFEVDKMDFITELKLNIKDLGSVVRVKNQNTIELTNCEFNLSVKEMSNFKFDKKLANNEDACYRDVRNGFKRIEKYLKKDPNTRKAIFISHHCISYLHVMIRTNCLVISVHMRSSDANKLETDMHVLNDCIKQLSKTLNKKVCTIKLIIDSAHIILGGQHASFKKT